SGYKIGSRTFQFKTLPEDPQSYRVCIFGDLGYEHGNSTDSIIPNGLAGKFDFIVHVGNDYMHSLQHKVSFIYVPYMVVAGNHENDGENFTNFQERFLMTPNGFHDNQFYSFDLGPIQWIGLSTEYYGYYDTVGKEPLPNQYKWLQQDLELANSNRHRTPWIVTYLHRPFYCSAAHNDDCTGLDSMMVRVGYEDMPGLERPFLQYGVDLGFWGHAHYYERFYPVADMHYWNAGCHSTDVKIDKSPEPFSAKRLNEYGYTIMTVANIAHIHLEQISIDREQAVVDDFWLSKDIGF
ncbi:Purple acid phosphatase, partial [Trichostrongylus colubriformis]